MTAADSLPDLTVVSTFFPLPQDRGDPVRVLMLLRAVARVRPYTLFVVRRPTTTDAEVAVLRRMLPDVTVTDFTATPYRFDQLGPLGRYPAAALAGLPTWVRTRYSHELHERLRERSGSGVALGEAAGAYLPDTALRWHWDKANVLTASTRQDIADAVDLPHRMRARYLAAVSTRFEARALAAAATVSVTSRAEAERLERELGRRPDAVLPSCVALPEGYTRQPGDRRLVWLSSFAYPPNLLGLRRFLDEGWPALHRAGFTLALVGSGLTDDLRREFAARPGLQVLGYVDDLRPVLGAARAAVVPVFSGAGVKLKTLTLLAHGVPVFSTPVGAEGIPPTPAVRLAESPADLARELLAASAAGEFDRMADEAVGLIRAGFSEQRLAAGFVRTLAAGGHLGAGVPGAPDAPDVPGASGTAGTSGVGLVEEDGS